MNIYYDVFKSIFPKGSCFAFSYGSSVFKQRGHVSSKNTMIDFVVAVENSVEWHKQNISKNPSHYSLLKYGGPKNIAIIQDRFGANVYYNTLIPTSYGLIKYGIISKENLISDLLDWETLYISGRLHKPVNIVYSENTDELNAALKINLLGALRTSLLLLPETFTEQQLYFNIAGLSYAGDFRMVIGEDQNKVQNIVLAQMTEFRKLYSPLLQEFHDFVIVDQSTGMGQQDMSPSTKLSHLSMLPKMLQHGISREWNKDGRTRDLEDVLGAAAMDPDSSDIVYKGIMKIVQKSSLSQSIKGVFTAGMMKSVRYSLSKLKKMWNSWQNL